MNEALQVIERHLSHFSFPYNYCIYCIYSSPTWLNLHAFYRILIKFPQEPLRCRRFQGASSWLSCLERRLQAYAEPNFPGSSPLILSTSCLPTTVYLSTHSFHSSIFSTITYFFYTIVYCVYVIR